MQTLKAKATTIKNHVVRNRGKYGFAAGAITAIALQVAVAASEDLDLDVDVSLTSDES